MEKHKIKGRSFFGYRALSWVFYGIERAIKKIWFNIVFLLKKAVFMNFHRFCEVFLKIVCFEFDMTKRLF